jgi:hypothetical protein
MDRVADCWFSYFSAIAHTIAAASTLLIALACIRLQFLSSALHDLQRSLADAFVRVARQDEYHREPYRSFLAEDWDAYFQAVSGLASLSDERFPHGSEYTASKHYVDSLIRQGRSLHDARVGLHRSLGHAFGVTMLSAGLSILAIPLAPWVSLHGLFLAWGSSGVILVVLLWLYYRLILQTLAPQVGRPNNELR